MVEMQLLRFPETEKLTLNIGYVDLGKIDLLIREGFYSNRSDFIRTAIRNQLSAQSAEVERVVLRQTFDVGLRDFTRAELESKLRSKERLSINVVGLARIATDVTGELAAATIDSITVLGAFQASAEVKAALAGRIH
jgi:Arc/MetJ-type ribon-helix-helix transcriptional regulator